MITNEDTNVLKMLTYIGKLHKRNKDKKEVVIKEYSRDKELLN